MTESFDRMGAIEAFIASEGYLAATAVRGYAEAVWNEKDKEEIQKKRTHFINVFEPFAAEKNFTNPVSKATQAVANHIGNSKLWTERGDNLIAMYINVRPAPVSVCSPAKPSQGQGGPIFFNS